MLRWQHDYPNRFILVQAVLLVALAAALNVGDLPTDALISRLAFAAGFLLWGFDTLLSSSHLRGERSLGNPLRWVNAGHMAWFFGTYLLLGTGADLKAASLIAPLVGAVFFGITMVFLPFGDFKGPMPPLPPGRYDTSRPLSDYPFWHAFYILWPFIVLALIAAMVAFPPDQGWDEEYLLFQIALLPWLHQAYPRAGDAPWLRGMLVIKIAGLTCLLFGLFWA